MSVIDFPRKKKSDRDKRILYRQVFASRQNPAGRAVLTDMLNELYFFSSHLENDEQVALNNFARKLLYNIGVWQERNVYDITEAFLGIPWDYKDQEEEE